MKKLLASFVILLTVTASFSQSSNEFGFINFSNLSNYDEFSEYESFNIEVNGFYQNLDGIEPWQFISLELVINGEVYSYEIIEDNFENLQKSFEIEQFGNTTNVDEINKFEIILTGVNFEILDSKEINIKVNSGDNPVLFQTEDAYVVENSLENFNTDKLEASQTSTIFLKFDISELKDLNVYRSSISFGYTFEPSADIRVYLARNDWDESTINSQNSPLIEYGLGSFLEYRFTSQSTRIGLRLDDRINSYFRDKDFITLVITNVGNGKLTIPSKEGNGNQAQLGLLTDKRTITSIENNSTAHEEFYPSVIENTAAFPNNKKEIVGAYNLLGLAVNVNTKNEVIILKYSDGSSERVFNRE